jgi:hypothetical protein
MIALVLATCLQTQEPARPLLRDFLGLNGHTVQFKPDLYRPVCRLARDYHAVEWDLGRESDFVPRFPEARNRVNWETVYGGWLKAGFEVDCSLMFHGFEAKHWKDVERDAFAYGRAFARAFGPSSAKKLVASAEIGNEPGHYDDALYRRVFEAMAKGLREGDPKIAILTCNLTDGKSHKYAKSVACVKGLEGLYDVLNVHTYAEAEPWPTWRRSFPEDPKLDYLKAVERIIAWRNANARGKPVWITEYGWDASTKKPEPKGDFAKWVGVTDEQQAQYLVRSTLVFMTLDVARAYVFFFNDDDQPSVHASSGLTRGFKPKPSYHALAHFMKTLGEFRLARVRQKTDEAWVFEFAHGADPSKRAIAAWSPSGSGRTATVKVELDGLRLARAERMPLTAGEAPGVEVVVKDGAAIIPLSESPVYLALEASSR